MKKLNIKLRTTFCLGVVFFILLFLPVEAYSASEYLIQVSHNDELFIINDEKFKAKTYCFNINKGDRVIFLEGSSLGACVSAKFIDLNTDVTCEVWCE